MSQPSENESKTLLTLETAGGVIVIFIGIIVLLGCASGWTYLTSFRKNIIPMAPSTAIFFMLLGIVLYIKIREPFSRKVMLLGIWISIFSLSVTFILFILSFQGIYSNLEFFGIDFNKELNGIPMGHMSPMTAICFIISSASCLLIITPFKGRHQYAKAAFWLSLTVIMISFVLVIAYIFGTPIMYRGNAIPPALPTSISFLILGIGLFSGAGTRIWPPHQLKERHTDPTTLFFIIAFLILITGIVMTGYLFYNKFKKHYRSQIEYQLTSITNSKTSEIVQWRKERLSDASVYFNNPNLSDRIKRLETNRNDTDNKSGILTWMSKIYNADQYDGMILFDNEMRIILTYPHKTDSIDSSILINAKKTMQSRKISFQDFYKDSKSAHIYLNMFIPILDIQDSNSIIGILSIRINPEQYLYQIINQWPIESKTAEALMVRREGNYAIFLNELRFQKNTSLQLKNRINNENMVSVMPLLGKRGIVEGIDYRNVPVLASISAIPDSPWFLISIMDMKEINVPLRNRLLITVILMVSFLLSTGAGIGFVWREQRIKYFRNEAESAEQIRKLNRVYVVLSDINQAIVRIRDRQILFNEACNIAVNKSNFKMAWIGILDNKSLKVNVVASAGVTADYLEKLDISLDDPERGQGPTATSIKTNQHVITNDILNNERMAPWRKDALRLGYLSSAVFPLRVNNKVIGTINIYAKEPDFFNEDEIKLLDELAMDISFALEFSEQEEQKKQAVSNLHLLNAELELRIAQRTAQLEESNKELEAFCYSVSHDLRAPLRSIIGFSNILLEETGEDLNGEAKKALNTIIKNTNRMNRLIDDLLSFSRMSRVSLSKDQVNVDEMVKSIFDELSSLEKRRNIEINLKPLKPCIADYNMIKQVWINLISNALKYTRKKDVATVEIGNLEENGEIHYYIKDNGAGFDMKYYDKLFGVFQRLHSSEEYEGTGVGLALANRIIHRHGGRIWADAKLGEGASFYFSIP